MRKIIISMIVDETFKNSSFILKKIRKTKVYHPFQIFPNSNRTIVERGNIDIPNTKYITAHISGMVQTL